MNDFFSSIITNLNIEGYNTDFCPNPNLSEIYNILEKFKGHPSILKIKETVKIVSEFHFSSVSEASVRDKINSLNKNKTSTYNNIPPKLLVRTSDIIAPVITSIYNTSKSKANFPDSLKLADITPVHKEDERTIKDNYRPISILPSISKIFELSGLIEVM